MSYLTLGELNQQIKQTISTQMEPSYWVVAEIGEMRANQRGHCYLELIEKDGNQLQAKIRATLWSYNFRRLGGWFTAITGEELRAGMKILAQVEVCFHEMYGLSLNIQDIDANFTLGERARRRQEVLAQLAEEGVLEMNKSLALPLVPQRIAVISSPTAAGLGDFKQQLQHNRYAYQFDIALFEALMQGNQAEESIIQAMHQIFARLQQDTNAFDLLVIIRGGGAQVDLDCFDSYELAAHIAQFPIPVLTGIGHERDETIADLVAHTHLKTPTAVAEFLISGLLSFEESLQQQWQRISQVSQHILREQAHALENMVQQLRFATYQKMRSEHEQLRQWQSQLRYAGQQQLRQQGDHLVQLKKSLTSATLQLLKKNQQQLQQYERLMIASDPERILRKGFSYTTVNGKPVEKNGAFQAGDPVETRTYQHILISRLEQIQEKNQHEQED